MIEQAHLMYEFGHFCLDSANRVLLHDGEPVPLAPKAFDILLALVENQGRVLSKNELIKLVWPDTFVEEINLTVQVSALRKALSDSPEEHRYVATIPRRGYRFVCPVAEAGHRAQFSSKLNLTQPDWWSNWRTRTIAVLPLKYLGMDEKGGILGASIADALISRLSGIEGILVRPTTAVLRFSDSQQDPIFAGKELSVDLVLDGTIQLVADRIRVNVQLVRVGDGATLWAENFDRDFTDIFAVQDCVSEQVALALRLRLSAEERRQLNKNYTQNIEAHQLYIKGRYFWDRRTGNGLKRGIEYFQKAIEVDPNYALAYIGLGDSYALLGEYLYIPPVEAFPVAKTAILRALDIDGTLAEAHSTLAEINMFYEWNWEESEREFKRCLGMKPNYATGRHSYTWFLMTMGRFHEALAQLQVAQDNDPYSLTINTAFGLPYYYLREYDKAISAYRQTLEMSPSFILAHYYLGSALI